MWPVISNIPWPLCLSVTLSYTLVSPVEMAEHIEMLFGVWSGVGPRNCLLDGGSEEGAFLRHIGYWDVPAVDILEVCHQRQHLAMQPYATITLASCH